MCSLFLIKACDHDAHQLKNLLNAALNPPLPFFPSSLAFLLSSCLFSCAALRFASRDTLSLSFALELSPPDSAAGGGGGPGGAGGGGIALALSLDLDLSLDLSRSFSL